MRLKTSKQQVYYSMSNFYCAAPWRGLHIDPGSEDLTPDFYKHIDQIQSQYHPDKQGQFGRLWPELTAK